MRATGLAAAVVVLLAAASSVEAQEETPITAALAVETFDTAWAVVHRTLWDTTFNGVDWQAVRAELRPRAEAARSYQGLRRVLGEMLGRLRLSHFGIIPREVQSRLAADEAGGAGAGRPGDAGMELRLVGDRFLVTHVAPGGAAAAAGVRPGWEIAAVGERTAAEVLRLLADVPTAREPRARQLAAWAAVAAGLQGEVGDTVRVRFRDGADREAEAALVLGPAAGTTTRLGNLPALAVRAGHERVELGDGAVAGVIRFNYWFPVIAPELDRAVDALRDADGIVIDLRGNPGGVGFMAPGFAGHFLERGDTLGTMTTRQGKVYFAANPRRVDTRARPVRPFAGPVAILTDALSASTSEIFAGGLQKLGRARVFGETSAGQALPAYARRLPDGDVMMHAVADLTGPGGERFEGAGVTPDVAAPPTREALLAGGDPALDAALRWIREARSR